MAITHITFNDQLPHGRLLRANLNKLQDTVDDLPELLDTFARMLNGDGTQEAHFTAYVLGKFGFSTAADAKAAWDELNSMNFKLQTNGSVSDVNAAIRQCLAKLR